MLKTVSSGAPDSLMAEMGMDIVVNARGEVAVLHGKPFTSPVNALEYDRGNRTLMFLFEDGTVRDFGIPLPESTAPKFRLARAATLYCMENDRIINFQKTIVRQIAT